ncbi:MAG: 16S rRNA (guanine(527)-N(7))-methyltransferase RsmG [Pseudomonadota bacterium]
MSRSEFLRKTDVSRETLERLDIYAELLRKWTAKINLVAASTLEELWIRHFLDSVQLLALAPHGRHWVDLGSGGGFPGAVVAVLAREIHPETAFTLVEADQRKAAFLRNVFRETEVKGKVIAARAEKIASLHANILSARALAPLSNLLEFSERHIATDGCALFLKGKKANEEIAQALEHWRFDCETHVSKTDEDAVILKIGAIERV